MFVMILLTCFKSNSSPDEREIEMLENIRERKRKMKRKKGRERE